MSVLIGQRSVDQSVGQFLVSKLGPLRVAAGRVNSRLTSLGGTTKMAAGRMWEMAKGTEAAGKKAKAARFPLSQLHIITGLMGGGALLLASQVGALDQRFFEFQVSARKLTVAMGQVINAGFAPLYPIVDAFRNLLVNGEGELTLFGHIFGKLTVVLLTAVLAFKLLAWTWGLGSRMLGLFRLQVALASVAMGKATVMARALNLAMAFGPLAIIAGLTAFAATGGFGLLGGGDSGGGKGASRELAMGQAGNVTINHITNQGSPIVERQLYEDFNDHARFGDIRAAGRV